MPSIAAHWIKNCILAAIISGVVSLAIYGARQATGAADADAGLGATGILYVVALILLASYGIANGVLTGAVLQRIVPLLPARTWIALHAAMAVIIGLGSEMLFTPSPRGTAGTDDVSTLTTLLGGFILGAILGAVIGGLQALVLRTVAFGAATWIMWSTIAYAIALMLFAGSLGAWQVGTDLAGELANQALGFFVAVIISLLMLPALRRLKSPTLSTAAQYFT
jgi:hypothetical protein